MKVRIITGSTCNAFRSQPSLEAHATPFEVMREGRYAFASHVLKLVTDPAVESYGSYGAANDLYAPGSGSYGGNARILWKTKTFSMDPMTP